MPKIKINWTLFVFLGMILLTIIEELTIGEGGFYNYLQSEDHSTIRFIIRGIYAVVLFSIGTVGLKELRIKWVFNLWIIWYLLAFIAATVRILFELKFHWLFNMNVWNLLSAIYYLLLTPIPYGMLWFLGLLFKTEK